MAKVISQTEVFKLKLNYTSNGQSGSNYYLRIIKDGNNPTGSAEFPMLQSFPDFDNLEVLAKGISQIEEDYQFVVGGDFEYIFDVYGNVYRQIG